jgi:hypothetical protein
MLQSLASLPFVIAGHGERFLQRIRIRVQLQPPLDVLQRILDFPGHAKHAEQIPALNA